MIEIEYEPTFEISENMAMGISEKRIGQKINAIANYQVIDKTKNYVVLRIKFLYLVSGKRKF